MAPKKRPAAAMARPAASMKRAAVEPFDLASPPRRQGPTNAEAVGWGITGFKSGPRNLESLLSWADEAVAYVLADPGSVWLQNLTERGVCIDSHFSGLMTAEVALEQLVRATQDQRPRADLREKLIDAWSCDTAKECLEVALSYDFDPKIWGPLRDGQRHVFSNILDAFSEEATEHVRKYQSYRNHGMEASKEALNTLQSYVLSRPGDALGPTLCWRQRVLCRREDCSVISRVCSSYLLIAVAHAVMFSCPCVLLHIMNSDYRFLEAQL